MVPETYLVHRTRPTIAVLIDYMTLFAGGYEQELRVAFDTAARRRGVNLVCVYGRPIAHQDAWYAAHNAIYDLIQAPRIDGVVAVSASLSSFIGPVGMEAFLARYRPLALCSAGVKLESVPSVVVDDRVAMEAALTHLVRDHGARRVAFIGGPAENPDSRARLAAYRAVLERYAIAFDAELVGTGDFVRRTAEGVVSDMLGRGLRPDAVVAANDPMALGAISALRAHGLRVPQDVLVSGFDDLEQARLADPPLTTVGQPLAAIAECALDVVLEQLAGRAVPLCTELPAEFIVRQSCGCNRRMPRAVATPAIELESPGRLRAEVTALQGRLASNPNLREAWADAATLLAGLARELDGEPQAFLLTLEELLSGGSSDNEFHQRLQVAITRLREELRGVSTAELEDRWNDARAQIALSNTQNQVQRRLEHDEIYHRLIEHGERLSTAPDWQSLQTVLKDSLPELGVSDAHIARYVEDNPSELTLFVGLRGGVPYVNAGPFAAHYLYPPGVDLSRERHTLLLFPLVFEAQRLGVAVFAYEPSVSGWQVMRDQIGAAMRSVALHREIVEQTTQHERSIREQERQATSKRIQSLSVLAGGVAHDLNNVLGPLVALPDLILHELGQGSSVSSGTQQVRVDLEVIRAAALRATQTIKDLLTLSQEGQIAKEPLELNTVVAACIAQEPPRFTAEARRRTNIRLDLHGEALMIRGSESHLVRVIANLLRNAIEAIRDDGEVRIRTSRQSVQNPIEGYETVPPADYAVVSVSDTGKGIPVADMGRVFEPFFSSKKLGDQSGSGLGLAIVHGVVKEHGGYIDLQSALQRGTTFTLYFPLITHVPPPRILPEPSPARGSAKILVVDDEPVQLRTASRILTQLGYQVDTINSGRKAFKLFADAYSLARLEPGGEGGELRRVSPYDLVIFDMILNEDRDGLQTLLDIEHLYPHQRAIIASGHSPTERTALAVSRGIEWLGKPYTSAALARAVQQALGAERALCTASVRSVREVPSSCPGR